MLYRAAVVCLAAVSCAGSALASPVVFFSIDGASPSAPSVSNNDVLAPGPVGGPPAVATPAAALGLPAGLPDELDAMTTGAPVDPLAIFFSVDRSAVGLPLGGGVFSEAAAGQAAGDVYVSGGGGTNALVFNQDILGLVPATAPGTPTFTSIDDLDALDIAEATGPGVLLFSLLAGNSFGFSGADLLLAPVGPGAPTIAVSAAALGLSFADDIDALHVDTVTGDCLFSLVPGSPSLTALAAGPGDVLVAPGCGGGPAPSVLFPALTLGLAPTDNLDALAFISEIPEPRTSALVALGLVALAARRHRTIR